MLLFVGPLVLLLIQHASFTYSSERFKIQYRDNFFKCDYYRLPGSSKTKSSYKFTDAWEGSIGSLNNVTGKEIVNPLPPSCVTAMAHMTFESPKVSLKERVHEVLQAIVAMESEEDVVHHIKITYNISTIDSPYSEGAWAVDEFVKYRPWWHIVKEPFDHGHQPHRHPYIVLKRYPRYELALQFLARRQYPMDCASMPLLLNRHSCVHPGWYSVIEMTQQVRDQLPLALYNQYFPHWNQEPADANKNAFITDKDCPTSVENQWECSFIPLTNCTMPSVISECKSINGCYVNGGSNNMGYESSLLTSADPTGKIVTISTAPGIKKRESMKGYGLYGDNRDLLNSVYPPTEFSYQIPFNTSLPPPRRRGSPYSKLFSYSMLTRPNAFYRGRIDGLLAYLRSSPEGIRSGLFNTEADQTCVAAHVRRGDRVMYYANSNKPIDMREFCYNVTLRPSTCMFEDGELKKCPDLGQVGDFGCDEKGVPFSSYSLLEVIQKAEQLNPTTRTLVVSTDDPVWLVDETRAVLLLRPEWTILSLPHPKRVQVKGQKGAIYIEDIGTRERTVLSGAYTRTTTSCAQRRVQKAVCIFGDK